MTVAITQSSFTAGELDPRLLGRLDLRAYETGARSLRNVVVQPTGGVSRRPGMAHVATAAGPGRLIAFESGPEGRLLLHLYDFGLDVYRAGAVIASIEAPWSQAELADITWAAHGASLLVCHPEVPPKRVFRDLDGLWTVLPWFFRSEGGATHQPYAKYADPEVGLETSGTTGTVTVTLTHPVLKAEHLGVVLRKQRQEILLTNIQSPTQALGMVHQTLDSAVSTFDWDEQAFSEARGFPIAVALHQNRLVIGGSRDLPNRLWFSKTGDPFNFDLGTGLDDQAITFGLTSERPQRIRALFSGRHLQVFTTGGEWIVVGLPLTPRTAFLQQQTGVGSPADRQVPPRDVDGATLFVGASGRDLREFLFTDTEQAYQAADLALLSRHLMVDPLDQDFDHGRRLFLIARADGRLAALALDRNSGVAAWSLLETDGRVLSLAVLGDDVMLLVERAQGVMLERLDDELMVDAGLRRTHGVPTTVVDGLDHLEGATVKIVGDGAPAEDAVVTDGAVTLTRPAREVAVGLGYAHAIEPLPLALATGRGLGQDLRYRPVRITFRVLDSRALTVDVGSGLRALPFRAVGDGGLDGPPRRFTGDLAVRALGWRRGAAVAPWRIAQDDPLPLTLLSVTTEAKVNV